MQKFIKYASLSTAFAVVSATVFVGSVVLASRAGLLG